MLRSNKKRLLSYYIKSKSISSYHYYSSLSLKHTYSTTTTTTNTAADSKHYHQHDILICGGGVVGSFLAADILHQSKGQCNIGIIDSITPSDVIPSSEEPPLLRVYALSPLRYCHIDIY